MKTLFFAILLFGAHSMAIGFDDWTPGKLSTRLATQIYNQISKNDENLVTRQFNLQVEELRALGYRMNLIFHPIHPPQDPVDSNFTLEKVEEPGYYLLSIPLRNSSSDYPAAKLKFRYFSTVETKASTPIGFTFEVFVPVPAAGISMGSR